MTIKSRVYENSAATNEEVKKIYAIAMDRISRKIAYDLPEEENVSSIVVGLFKKSMNASNVSVAKIHDIITPDTIGNRSDDRSPELTEVRDLLSRADEVLSAIKNRQQYVAWNPSERTLDPDWEEMVDALETTVRVLSPWRLA